MLWPLENPEVVPSRGGVWGRGQDTGRLLAVLKGKLRTDVQRGRPQGHALAPVCVSVPLAWWLTATQILVVRAWRSGSGMGVAGLKSRFRQGCWLGLPAWPARPPFLLHPSQPPASWCQGSRDVSDPGSKKGTGKLTQSTEVMSACGLLVCPCCREVGVRGGCLCDQSPFLLRQS